jgi:hypothetical protein
MGGSGNPPEPVPALKPDTPGPRSDFERVQKRVREEVARAALPAIPEDLGTQADHAPEEA